MADDEKRKVAEDGREWLTAYMDAGFSREEAVAFMVATAGRAQIVTSQLPPEMMEFLQKQNLLLDDVIEER